MAQVYIHLITAIILWGSWPAVLRASGAVGSSAAALLTVVATLPVLMYSFTTNQLLPVKNSLLLVIIAALMNGIGMVSFQFVTTDKTISLSKALPILNAGAVVVVFLCGILFFNEKMTFQKFISMTLIVSGILLMMREGN